MTPRSIAAPVFAACLLSACGGSDIVDEGAAEDTSTPVQAERSVAEDFAERINSGNPDASQYGATAPTPPPPQTASTQATACNSQIAQPFVGEEADEPVRRAIVDAIVKAGGDARAVRFIGFGAEAIDPDPTKLRLNLMLDRDGVIRDARCG